MSASPVTTTRARMKVRKIERGVFTLSARRSMAQTKGPVFATQYFSQVISGALAVEKDERPATKERMWFLLWS